MADMKDFFKGFYSKMYLFLIHKLNFKIISNLKNGNLFYSSIYRKSPVKNQPINHKVDNFH